MTPVKCYPLNGDLIHARSQKKGFYLLVPSEHINIHLCIDTVGRIDIYYYSR